MDHGSVAGASRISTVQGGAQPQKTPKIRRFRADTVGILAICGETES
jgi:hypothetical protein